jgi:transposase-like protein
MRRLQEAGETIERERVMAPVPPCLGPFARSEHRELLLSALWLTTRALPRRRRWSEELKQALVAAAFAPGAVVAEVADRADVCPGQIYRWRQELGDAGADFAAVVAADADCEQSIAPCPGEAIEMSSATRSLACASRRRRRHLAAPAGAGRSTG